MKAYENLYILRPDATDEAREKINEQLSKLIEKNGGEVTLFKDLGMKDLATEFAKLNRGFYYQCQFVGNNKILDELNQKIRVSEIVFRHLIVTLDSIQEPTPK